MSNPESSPLGEKQRLIRGSFFLTLSPAAALILGLVISKLIELYIPQAEYANFEWFNVMNSFFMNIIPFQMPGAIARYMSVAKGAKDDESLESLVKASSVLSLILVPISGLVAFITTPLIFTAAVVSAESTFLNTLIFSGGVMAINLAAFTQGASSGFQEFEKVGKGNLLGNTVSQLVVMILIPLGWGINALLLKWVLAGSITAIFLSLVVREIWSLRGERYPLRPLLEYSYPAIIAFLFAYFFNEFLIRKIFDLYEADALGLYGFAVRILTFVTALTLGFYNALNPYYARAVGEGGLDALEEEVQWTLKISFFLFLPMIIGAMVIAPAGFLIVFPNYYWAYQYFLILILQIFFYLFVKPFFAILNSIAKTKLILASSVLAALLSGMLMILLIDYGLIIVLIAYVSGSFFAAVFAGLWAKKETGITLGVPQVIPFTILSFAIMIPTAMIHFLRLNPFIELAINAVLFLTLYIVSIRYLRIVSAYEIERATIFLPKRMAQSVSKALIRVFTRNDS